MPPPCRVESTLFEGPLWVESGHPRCHHVGMKLHGRLAALAMFVAPMVTSCGSQAADKLYNKEGSFEVTGMAQLDEAVLSISRATGAPVRDREKDLDGNPQYLLSNEEVMIFVRHHFGESCVLVEACRWDYTISATDTALREDEQRRLVDGAFQAIASANP
jgi:hypothetical protein